ncbi:MAG TPA: hypothetical protein K8V90_06910 [Romboutsia timonensis]|uniref:Uncharacterized protein n=1 Tax=Romboutsia timonensis TaxID=1776391 RepID=A0A921N0N6_9FIRM|nr:hypothetical protein [Romboutsia timonensis]
MNGLRFDKEYSTQYWKEVKFLEENGVKYTFVKTLENGISIFKYKKDSELFRLLSLFYLENK